MSGPDFFGALTDVFDETLRYHSSEVSVIGQHIGLILNIRKNRVDWVISLALFRAFS